MIYDTAVIGGGPAGYLAAIYCAYNGIETVLLEKLGPGGQMGSSHNLKDYMGIDDLVGPNLGDRLKKLADHLGAKTVIAEVDDVDLDGKIKKIHTDKGIFESKTVIIATGALPKKMGIKDEEILLGRGISYCAACEGAFFKGKTAAVYGDGHTAVADSMCLSEICSKVYLIHPEDNIIASRKMLASLRTKENVVFVPGSRVTALKHDGFLNGVILADAKGKTSELKCDALFVSLGRVPNNELVGGRLKTDANGYVSAGEDCRTEIPGVFVAGDLRSKPFKQVLTAAADGVNAFKSVQEYLESL